LSHASVKDFAKQLGLAVCALELVAVSRELGLEHVHIHSAADAAHLGALSRAWGGPPYSLTLHGDLDVYGTNHPQKMKGASFVAAVTRPLQEQVLRATGLPSAAVPLIWMGVDTERFSPAPLDWSAPLRLLTVARLNRQKGHTYALQAVKKCLSQGIDLTYTIVGSGDHQSAIEREVEQLGLQGVVKLTGTLSEDEVLQLLRSSHVFLLPSIGLGEAAPVSVMEAMSCGRAVVCSRIGGTPDMIRDGVDGYLVEQADVDGLTAALMRLSREPSTAEAICSAARQRALEQFDHRTLAGHLAREIANARHAR
jgi:glycosyltransferase involved in cell wall biosynthesis